ncbi:hypothetical protein FMM79_19075 [Novosphingobium sp. BW1]|nr:hypothetical protein [Novosphingobium sp. BW1]TYC83817.1 hypothetical protein FMM79_19075 [Novosphingobium sp. BW1]
MRSRRAHPDQMSLDWSKDAEIERIIEARVAIRAETEAIRWRFRLIFVESLMMAALVLAAGLTLGQPTALLMRGAFLVGIACFASGMLLIVLSGVTCNILDHVRRRRRRS